MDVPLQHVERRPKGGSGKRGIRQQMRESLSCAGDRAAGKLRAEAARLLPSCLNRFVGVAVEVRRFAKAGSLAVACLDHDGIEGVDRAEREVIRPHQRQREPPSLDRGEAFGRDHTAAQVSDRSLSSGSLSSYTLETASSRPNETL